MSGAAAPHAPHAIHVSISTIVYLAKIFASFKKHATLIIHTYFSDNTYIFQHIYVI